MEVKARVHAYRAGKGVSITPGVLAEKIPHLVSNWLN